MVTKKQIVKEINLLIVLLEKRYKESERYRKYVKSYAKGTDEFPAVCYANGSQLELRIAIENLKYILREK